MFFRFFFFLIEQLNVIIGSLSLLFTALYFQFCLRDTEKKKKDKKITGGHKRMADFVFSECVHKKNSLYFVSTCIATSSISQNKLNYRSQTYAACFYTEAHAQLSNTYHTKSTLVRTTWKR